MKYTSHHGKCGDRRHNKQDENNNNYLPELYFLAVWTYMYLRYEPVQGRTYKSTAGCPRQGQFNLVARCMRPYVGPHCVAIYPVVVRKALTTCSCIKKLLYCNKNTEERMKVLLYQLLLLRKDSVWLTDQIGYNLFRCVHRQRRGVGARARARKVTSRPSGNGKPCWCYWLADKSVGRLVLWRRR